MPIIYNKPALSVDQQIDLLESRGLSIPDKNKACHYLQFINYYRLSGYTIYFEQIVDGKRNHQFKPGTTFNDILDLYDFDRHLRILIKSHPFIKPTRMGFSANWQDDSFWGVSPV